MKTAAIIAIFLLFATTVSAQSGLDPVATFEYRGKTVVITSQDFRESVALEERLQGKKLDHRGKEDLLDSIVRERLVQLDMEAHGISWVTERDVADYLLASTGARSIEDVQRVFESQNPGSWESAVLDLQRKMFDDRFLKGYPTYVDAARRTAVTDQDVAAYFASNIKAFVAPEYVRFSQIFFDTARNPKGTPQEIRKRADDALKRILSGRSTFEEIASAVSEDPASAKANGEVGWVPMLPTAGGWQQIAAAYGSGFLDDLSRLKTGEVSGIVTSRAGIHILRISQRIAGHQMGLTDPVTPGATVTVGEYIRQGLIQQRGISLRSLVAEALANDLVKVANFHIWPSRF